MTPGLANEARQPGQVVTYGDGMRVVTYDNGLQVQYLDDGTILLEDGPELPPPAEGLAPQGFACRDEAARERLTSLALA